MSTLKPAAGIKILANQRLPYQSVTLFSVDKCKAVRRFHNSMADYKPTPLVSLDNLAAELGITKVYVKDESSRFGLNSFKALGASYGMARLLADNLGREINTVTDEYLTSHDVKEKINAIVFVSATDGNHGRAVAWCAARLGCKSVIYLPKGAAVFRVQAIQNQGAETQVTDLNYDDAVRLATRKASENGWTLMQDTAMPGYEQIPAWIMQGYTTMVAEALDQIERMDGPMPTHVFLQAGVGSMSGAILGFLVERFKGKHPITVIIEPENAACMYKSTLAGDGQPHRVEGGLETIMAGLACGEPNPMGWEILRDYADFFVSCPDYVTTEGMRRLAKPLGTDTSIVSGESGAVGIGFLEMLMHRPNLAGHKNTMGLDEDSVVLAFSTEGDTDPENYRQIVHNGQISSPL